MNLGELLAELLHGGASERVLKGAAEQHRITSLRARRENTREKRRLELEQREDITLPERGETYGDPRLPS